MRYYALPPTFLLFQGVNANIFCLISSLLKKTCGLIMINFHCSMLKALYSRSGIEKDFLGSNPTLALKFGFIGNLKNAMLL